jgi:hypothetical protein
MFSRRGDDEVGRMLVLQPLTRDRALVAKAVEKAAGSIWVEKSADTLAVPAIVDRRDAGRELIGESGERPAVDKATCRGYYYNSSIYL